MLIQETLSSPRMCWPRYRLIN